MIRPIALVMCTLLTLSAAAATSVWDEARTSANEVTGKITSIAVDNDDILVRIADSKGAETYKVCTVYPGGDGLSIAENERMKSLRDAFNRGDTVRAAFNGPFDRCLSRVELTKPPGDPIKEKVHAVSKAEGARKPSAIVE